jgi:curved DNA-binding protein CbpA|tara:strand:- start:799 stop:1338 length:540 start_codon:yes stop_codon:yes gene_type:complete
MFKDYYAILDISQSATLLEIKSAYRTQAMKWHPDKNQGVDTTEKMKEINEAKLILNDEDARVRYDREYLRFKSFQKNKEKENKTEKQEQNEKKHSRKETKHEKETEKPKESYSTYQFDDEILRKWMENARKQALRNVQEMINEFSNSSLIGFGAFFKTALMAIVIGFIFFIIVQILRLI